ncbi:Por secretion system C-terminal sorting domain-containing protein [Flavobacterium sp. CF108]|uniref:glycosyl hydrolase n=1 Tax=unclassified Flavobacterium TaxID=196869 RepID=UPI0008CE1677|nr:MULTISPECIES: glycosyl hydrolase [unclassified Flavobacterium]SEP02873.1 Por secretion system C-terminal sorting domain-containing protein [Flavobacterium sp. fv08]SHH98282.1 Por secretion system C-terminal sorting domain-containing protein [Flavobacterium sp. CF108]
MIKKLLFTFSLITVSITAFAQSPKRGIAYGNNSTADLLALKPGISWWYNWGSLPENDVNANYATLGVEYVPMIWGKLSDAEVQNFINRIKPGAKYLLAFNEPNFNDGARLTPQEAVNAWVNVEKVAAAKNLEIVSASPAFNGPDNYGGYSSPTAWHDQFFLLCPDCKVDYIAFHTYDSSSGAVIGVTGLLKKYNRPVWVTEFANRVIQSEADKIAFMKQILNSFENDPDIYRYSWFTGRVPAEWTDMLEGQLLSPASGVLKPIGTEYINVSYTTKKLNVPGRITANQHYRRKGTGLQNTTDSGTGQNVCFIDSGDWNEFMLNVANAGTYNLTFRVASPTVPGKFDILVNDVVVKTDETFPVTGGYQTYADKVVNGVTLPKGEVYLKIKFKSSDMNFNYIDVASGNLSVNDPKADNDSFTIYPNPIKVESTLHIKSFTTEPISLKIVDMKGSVCFSSNDYSTNEDIKIGDKLATGVYIVNVSYGSITKSMKIIKN